MNNKIFVVAGNYRQFCFWCDENKISKNSPLVSYIDESYGIYKMQGISNPNVVYYGTYYKRNDIEEIELFIKSRTFKPDQKLVKDSLFKRIIKFIKNIINKILK